VGGSRFREKLVKLRRKARGDTDANLRDPSITSSSQA